MAACDRIDPDLAASLAELEHGLRVPARMRVFAEPGLLTLLGDRPAEWAGAAEEVLAGAAAGAAVAEGPRRGRVALIRPAHAPRAPLHPALRALAGAALVEIHHGAADPRPPDRPAQPREWQPVALPCLPRDQHPPWPAGVSLDAALAWVASRTARLLLPHSDPTWQAVPDSPAKLAALAALAGEGRRICWRLTAGTPLAAWLPVLAGCGARNLPLKLVCEAADLPPEGLWPGLPGWWLVEASQAAERDALLAWALAGEEPVLLSCPAAVLASAIDPVAAADPWLPGSARWLARPPAAAGTIACRPAHAAVAASLAAHHGLAVLSCTSLAPLPLADLAEAPGRLLVLDDRPAGDAVGFAAALRAGTPRPLAAIGPATGPQGVADALSA